MPAVPSIDEAAAAGQTIDVSSDSSSSEDEADFTINRVPARFTSQPVVPWRLPVVVTEQCSRQAVTKAQIMTYRLLGWLIGSLLYEFG